MEGFRSVGTVTGLHSLSGCFLGKMATHLVCKLRLFSERGSEVGKELLKDTWRFERQMKQDLSW